MNEKGRLVVVLDGFDEMKHAMTWADFRSQIADLNRLTRGRAKVVLLGRPSAFLSFEEHNYVLRGLKAYGHGYRRLPEWPEFIEYDLQEFYPSERKEFLESYLECKYQNRSGELSGMIQARAKERASEANQLANIEPNVFNKPVHAKILADLACDPSVDLTIFKEGLSRWDLYTVFFGSLAEREVDKQARRSIGEQPRLVFLREVAYWLWKDRGGIVSFHASDLPDTLVQNYFVDEVPELEALKREYLVGSFLEKKEGDLYFFSHRSFAEFLVAERLYFVKPTGVAWSDYSALAKGGVMEFLGEAPSRTPFAEWVEALVKPSGVIHLEFIDLIASSLGGLPVLIGKLPDDSLLASVLGAYSGHISKSGAVLSRIIQRMRNASLSEFFLLLSVYRFSSHMYSSSVVDHLCYILAALLDRFFTNFPPVWTSDAKPSLLEESVSSSSVNVSRPLLEWAETGKTIRVHGSRLMNLQSEHLRRIGFDLASHSRRRVLDLTATVDVPLPAVLERMKGASRAQAEKLLLNKEWRESILASVGASVA